MSTLANHVDAFTCCKEREQNIYENNLKNLAIRVSLCVPVLHSVGFQSSGAFCARRKLCVSDAEANKSRFVSELRLFKSSVEYLKASANESSLDLKFFLPSSPVELVYSLLFGMKPPSRENVDS